MPRKRLIPFKFMPGSWGLKGIPYAEAEAAYLYEGEEFERRIVEIRHADDPRELAKRTVALDLKYGRIDHFAHDCKLLEIDGALTDRTLVDLELRHGRVDAFTHARRLVEIDHPDDGTSREIALLEVEFQHGRIERPDYEKRMATLRDEPWVGIVNHGFDPAQGVNGVYFEFDWNPQWIEYLRQNGYSGRNEEQVFEQWFADVCRSQSEGADLADLPVKRGTPAR